MSPLVPYADLRACSQPAGNEPPPPAAAAAASAAAIDRCLDPIAMRPALAGALARLAAGRPSPAVDTVQISQVRRSGSRQRHPHPLSLLYTLQLAADTAPLPPGWAPALLPALGAGRAQGPQQLALIGRLCRPGASAAAAALAGPGVLQLPALDLLLWPWQHDPGLPQLPRLLQPEAPRPATGLGASAVQLLHHLPGERATLRIALAAPGGAALTAYAKTFADDRAAAVLQRFRHLWQPPQAGTPAALPPPTVPQPLGHDAALRTLWLAQAPGQALAPLLADGSLDAAPWLPVQLARVLATLHAAPLALAGPTPRDRLHWLGEIERRRRKLGRALPALATRIDRLADDLRRASDALPEPAPVLLHGDFHPGQLWLHGCQPVLFDLDECCAGDPMEDLAAFLTRLGTPGQPQALAAALCRAHASLAPQQHDAGRLAWHLALQQLLQAGRGFVYQPAGWPALVDARLAAASQLAQRCLARLPRRGRPMQRGSATPAPAAATPAPAAAAPAPAAAAPAPAAAAPTPAAAAPTALTPPAPGQPGTCTEDPT